MYLKYTLQPAKKLVLKDLLYPKEAVLIYGKTVEIDNSLKF